ncbi:MAG: aryl-sulfate sulfotransferase [Flavobacteriales bacterium]|nr:aryl-sulfate sulfotransferase [Flavobacteriales bacterium]
MKYIISTCLLMFLTLNVSWGQSTVGLTEYTSGNKEGFVLFSPMTSSNTYLIDKCGEKVHQWSTSSYRPALSVTLLEDGSLVRTGKLDNPNFNEGGSGGIIERFDWDGNLTWNYTISDTDNCLHHDIKVLPNGNILCIVWDRYTKQEAVQNGKDTSYNQQYLWSEKIVELQPVGNNNATVVWEWKLFDHLIQENDNTQLNYGVVSEHPELIDINYFPGAPNTADWIHFNSIDYNPDLDQILVSSHRMCEVWIIDHSTTTAEAATHTGGNSGMGGDLLYRWGNPQAYSRGTGANKVFYGQHHATWIPNGYPNEGKIMVFNNGLGRLGDYSSIDIIIPPLNASNTYDVPSSTPFLPTGLDWSYVSNPQSDFYSSNISGVYPLDNGSFMITEGTSGRFFEINPFQQKLWEYVNPVFSGGIANQGDTVTGNPVFRCEFYNSDYEAFVGKDLTPQGEIELNPMTPSMCELVGIAQVENETSFSLFPNPFTTELHYSIGDENEGVFELYDALGTRVIQEPVQHSGMIKTNFLPAGMYYYQLKVGSKIVTGKLVKP